jgi:integrase
MARIERGGIPHWHPDYDPPTTDEGPTPDAVWVDKTPDEVLVQQSRDWQDGRAFDPFDEVWADRVERDRPEPVPADRTVGAQVALYLENERARVEKHALSPGEYALVRHCLNVFSEWAGADSPVDTLNADRWEAWWRHLLARDVSADHKQKHLRHARNFIEWLADKGVITAPPNLHRKQYRFGGGAKAVPTMTVEEVRTLIEKAKGQFRLHLLLMLNCGFTQKDISDLRQDEVDWAVGRIVRKRGKTARHANVPTVEYVLWPETFALLRAHRSGDPDRVLVTRSGAPWVNPRMEGEKTRFVDNIRVKYYRLRASLNKGKPCEAWFTKRLKDLRKTGATLLGRHSEHRYYAEHYLGHAPRSVAAKHYIAPARDQFDAALTWLGEQLGFVPPAP